MTDLFAPRPAHRPLPRISKAQLRGAIWLLALAAFVLLPKPFAEAEPVAPIAADR
ncbi:MULTISPECIES: hypothetical protein [unclassified Devosia]|uniref:hypothetical protein n=1 Tax=unclassified Devosia TaxID=196773 RepID=UPI001ACDB52E|nr:MULTISPECIES: hypothetical protein [unclassified Devosia]MBN9362627.1 hypothetical protein [Devosia sp.]